MIRVERLSHAYGDGPGLSELGFSVSAGEKLVLLGANGSGKSTLLKILAGLITPSRGTYEYEGENITPQRLKQPQLRRRFRQQVALLFQNPDVMLFNPSVEDEIAFGPRQWQLGDTAERVRHWAALLGVEHLMERPPFSLSGGEKQKVALAALLVMEPRLLLLDEPAAALDPRSTAWLVDFLAGLPITILTTTHNLGLAAELGGRALVLGEDHRLLYDGPIGPFLEDREGLIAANLAHRHRHTAGNTRP